MRSILFISVFTLAFLINASPQRACIVKNELATGPVISGSAIDVPMPEVIIIPVVVHVVYNTPEQNISNEQIKSQINILNQDYRKKNSDAAYIPAAFREIAADAGIEFRLATIDPSGLSTNGITRTKTAITAFGLDDQIKSSALGGEDAWNRNLYLNIWVGNLTGGTVGYASVPGCIPEKDGVVIRYNAFGNSSLVQAPYNKGRTAVHEVGHWLGLRHIWGDAECGDDKIDDTPPQAGPTRGCPSGVISTCTSGASGNMYMNFMDFTNDECINMFTTGQAKRMREHFSAGGARATLLSSDRAKGAEAVEGLPGTNTSNGALYPNPAGNTVKLFLANVPVTTGKIIIYNNLGQICAQFPITKNQVDLNIKNLRSGMYFVSIGGKEVIRLMKN